MIGVQLIGKQAVIDAFGKLQSSYPGVSYWGIYEGKNPKIFGEGADQLADWLGLFCTSGSTATYTLRAYDTDELPTSQTGTSDYVASLNFKLVDMYEGNGIAGHSTKLVQRLEAIEKRMAGEDDDDDDTEDIQSIIMGWLSSPEKLGMVAGAIRTLLGNSGAGVPAVASAAVPAQQSISGFNTASSDVDDKLTRLTTALDQLEKHDPLLLEHLEKLAKLAANDPLIFKAVIGKLDAL